MITITINTDNDAFQGGNSNYEHETARILRALADRVEYACQGEYFPIRDINGNKVGEFNDGA